MVDVRCAVPVVEVDGVEVKIGADRPALAVSSHGIHSQWIVLKFPPDARTITVLARDLGAAIENATNVGR